MKKGKSRSEATLKSQSSQIKEKEEVVLPPLDVLKVNVKSLRFSNEDRRPHNIAVTFFDQLLFSDIIKPLGARDLDDGPFYSYIVGGAMSFDPSDYTKMCLFADHPLTGETKMCISRRMEPLIEPTALQLKSWDNLPLITMELRVARNPENVAHHKILDAANAMRMTVIGAYNVLVPYDETFAYVTASKITLSNEETSGVATYNLGLPYPKKFSVTSFYPKWESLALGDVFRKCEDKLRFNLDDVQNNEKFNLSHYVKNVNQNTNVFWGSFHRTLVPASDETRLARHLRRYQWPIEFHLFGEDGGYSFMGFLDLFKLLYPGETTVRLAVPVQWANAAMMVEKCGCEPLLTPNYKELLSATLTSSPNPINSAETEISSVPPTGADGGNAFLIVEVQLAKPLVKATIPPIIPESEIKNMLAEKMGDERKDAQGKPRYTGRGQRNTEWNNTVENAAKSLRKVPHFGMTEFCAFNRQLSETRVRVELTSSFWQDAAVYVNNNFVVQDFVQSDNTFEVMLMMGHACLMREATTTLLGDETAPEVTLRAARHARHHQDIPHATELYMQLVSENPNNANSWRELATCLMDEDPALASACINESLLLNPRHPLTLLSKGSMLYEKDPDSADLFFTAILALYPLWTTGWAIAEAFYGERQEFQLADVIKKYINRTRAKGIAEDLAPERGWEKELGDWWYPTPLLPGMSYFFDASDLLLRLRGMPLAEACLGRALSGHGESPTWSHLVALTCRLRGDVENALCHLQGAFESFGEVNYLYSLEAECLNKLKDRDAALVSFEKSGHCINSYSTLSLLPCRDPQRTRGVIIELLRQQPSAYAWMALSDDWLMRQAATGQLGGAGDAEAEVAMSTCAAACAQQALKWDRRCARAWAILARHSKPRARRAYCKNMATTYGYDWFDEQLDVTGSKESLCFRLSKALRECHCNLCETSNKYDIAHSECECVKSIPI